MEISVKMKLSTGKEIELTSAEIEELVVRFQKTNIISYPYVVQPFVQPYPWRYDTPVWTSITTTPLITNDPQCSGSSCQCSVKD